MDFNNEDDYLMLSGIQHFQFCKRQWALIHIEQQWEENVKTMEGQHVHSRADQPFIKEKRRDKIVVRALPVKSKKLKITGVCDVVEFYEDEEKGVPLQGSEQLYVPAPVEYKRGKPKKDDSDILQLTAQAMCLEEMLVCEIGKGYLYYHEVKQRVEVSIDDKYRSKVAKITEEMFTYFNKRHTPKVKTGAFCRSCSLQNICLPKLMKKETVHSYLERKLHE